MVFHTGANMAYSVLTVLGVYAARQALLCYVRLLVLTAVLVVVALHAEADQVCAQARGSSDARKGTGCTSPAPSDHHYEK